MEQKKFELTTEQGKLLEMYLEMPIIKRYCALWDEAHRKTGVPYPIKWDPSIRAWRWMNRKLRRAK